MFISFFFPKKEERNEPKKEERNGCEHIEKTRSHKQARGFSHIKYCRDAPATTQSIKSSEKRNKHPENASVLRAFL